MHGEIPWRTVLGEVHPVGAPNKTLISDTAIQLFRKHNLRAILGNHGKITVCLMNICGILWVK